MNIWTSHVHKNVRQLKRQKKIEENNVSFSFSIAPVSLTENYIYQKLSFSKMKETHTPLCTQQKKEYSKPFAGYEVPPVVVIWQTKLVNLL